MKRTAHLLATYILPILLMGSLFVLTIQIGTLARRAKCDVTDLSMRNSDFPATYISAIQVDLTSPHHWVTVEWDGPRALDQVTGPFHSSPGMGLRNNDCNDPIESNRYGSECTPKGTKMVEAFSDCLPSFIRCKYVTWIDLPREIAFHSHSDIPDYPASHGCIRLNESTAQLIHNNAIAGKTKVTVDGTWTSPRGIFSKHSTNSAAPIIDSTMSRADALEGVNHDCPSRVRNHQVLIDVEYYSFDGMLHRGQILIDRDLAADIAHVFEVARSHRFPIASVVPVSHARFRRNGKWDDELSMKANNTSGFNYRPTVTGQFLSDHACGRAIDINPLQNPYINGNITLPIGAIYDPTCPGTLTADHIVVRTFLELGWSWGGHWRYQKDYQHFYKPDKEW